MGQTVLQEVINWSSVFAVLNNDYSENLFSEG
jgi:hypothetical protein